MPRTHVSLLKPIETCMPSQNGLFFDVRQRHRRSLHELRLLAIRRAIRGFGTVKSNPLVGVVAERLVRAVAAAAKRVLCLVRMLLPMLPLHRLAGAVGADNLLAKR